MISILVLVFILCLLLRFSIAFSLGLACLVYVIIKGIPLIILPMKMYSGIDVFVLLSIPGFILAGNLMDYGGADIRKQTGSEKIFRPLLVFTLCK